MPERATELERLRPRLIRVAYGTLGGVAIDLVRNPVKLRHVPAPGR